MYYGAGQGRRSVVALCCKYNDGHRSLPCWDNCAIFFFSYQAKYRSRGDVASILRGQRLQLTVYRTTLTIQKFLYHFTLSPNPHILARCGCCTISKEYILWTSNWNFKSMCLNMFQKQWWEIPTRYWDRCRYRRHHPRVDHRAWGCQWLHSF